MDFTDMWLGLQVWQWFILALTVLACMNYLWSVIEDRMGAPRTYEGFQANRAAAAPSAADESKYEWIDTTALYDNFYCDLYDKLVQGEKRTLLEANLLRGEWEQATPTLPVQQWRVLDVGCGTGILTAAIASMGVQSVVGLDRSEAMIRRVRSVTIPATTLTDAQKGAIELRLGDAGDISAAREAEFTHAAVMYFVIYYIEDKVNFFRNLAYWVAPGGAVSVHVVNKHKFDPMLEAAAPTVFSLQKYADRRILKSQVAFDTFDYEGDFDFDEAADGTAAEFRETFRFKDGSARRQKHALFMPEIGAIVSAAQTAGWQYRGYVDNVVTGFEYTYTLLFTH